LIYKKIINYHLNKKLKCLHHYGSNLKFDLRETFWPNFKIVPFLQMEEILYGQNNLQNLFGFEYNLSNGEILMNLMFG